MSAATLLFRRDIQTTEAITLGKATRSIRRCICGDMTRGRRLAACSPCVGFFTSSAAANWGDAVARVLLPERRVKLCGSITKRSDGLTSRVAGIYPVLLIPHILAEPFALPCTVAMPTLAVLLVFS